jgi:hypothetical protein
MGFSLARVAKLVREFSPMSLDELAAWLSDPNRHNEDWNPWEEEIIARVATTLPYHRSPEGLAAIRELVWQHTRPVEREIRQRLGLTQPVEVGQ